MEHTRASRSHSSHSKDGHHSHHSHHKDNIYEVQEIVGMKSEGDVTVYRVRWKGYGPQSDTWEPESNLRGVWKMVEKYKTRTNKMPLVCSARRRGRPSAGSSGSGSSSGSTSSTGSGSGAHSAVSAQKNSSSTVDQSRRSEQRVMNGLKRHKSLANDTAKHLSPQKISRKSHKKRPKYTIGCESTKDTFWKDLEDGKIDVFKEDLYSRVKSRASSRGNSAENSPKPANSPPKESEKSWTNSDTNDSDKSLTTDISGSEDYAESHLRVQFCKTEALMSAIKDCDRELAKILIKNGSDVNSTFGNKEGSTPLMLCCKHNNIDMTDFLLNNGALIDTQNRNGDTALIILTLVLTNNNEFEIMNFGEQLIITIQACRLGFKQIIRLLLIYGSNFAQITRKGTNALRVAKTAEQAVKDILVEHISKLTISLEIQVLNILCNTASIVNALFPIQCYSLSEGKQFRLWFEFEEDSYHRKPGVGYILFVANTNITETDIKCQFSGPSVVDEVLVNGIAQKPLTEGAQFVFSFQPLSRGTNELVLKTVDVSPENRHIKLLVCAYELKLTADSHCYDKQQN